MSKIIQVYLISNYVDFFVYTLGWMTESKFRVAGAISVEKILTSEC